MGFLKKLLRIIAIILIIIAIVYLIAALLVYLGAFSSMTGALQLGAAMTKWYHFALVGFVALSLAYVAHPEVTTYFVGKVSDGVSSAASAVGGLVIDATTGLAKSLLSNPLVMVGGAIALVYFLRPGEQTSNMKGGSYDDNRFI